MSTLIKHAGVWKEPEMIYVKDGGIWKEVGGGGSVAPGEMEWTSPGTYQFYTPVELLVCVVCVGAGARGLWVGGGGGALAWGNDILLPAGSFTEVIVGAPAGSSGPPGDSRFGSYVIAGGGIYRGPEGGNSLGGEPSGSHLGGGGKGGDGIATPSQTGGGGGAGGYLGDGGAGTAQVGVFYPGSGGAAAGAARSGSGYGPGGGGVGIYGIGASGTSSGAPGSGGSPGKSGSTLGAGAGGAFGGGGGGSPGSGASGGSGAVRVIWGDGRFFPGTNVEKI